MAVSAGSGGTRDNVSPDCFATNLYFDRVHGINAVKVLPGEFYATPDELLLVTVLGSCVAACIRDPQLGIGGMNHFMLPDTDSAGPAGNAARYGSYAMEMLINHLIKLGAVRSRLEAKVFGGGAVIAGMSLCCAFCAPRVFRWWRAIWLIFIRARCTSFRGPDACWSRSCVMCTTTPS